MRKRMMAVAAIVLTGAAAPTFAHPKLVSASPAPNATVATATDVRLSFSERLLAPFSKADLLLTSTPTARLRAPIRVPVRSAVSSNGKGFIVTPAKPLVTGSYKLLYRMTSVDPHRVQGSYVFTVK